MSKTPELDRLLKQDLAHTKHDAGINKLIHRLVNSSVGYDMIRYEYEYGPKSHLTGECDVYAVKKDRILYFEMKTRHTRKHKKKAVYQLNRDVQHLTPEGMKPYKFYTHWNKQGSKLVINKV